MVINDWIYFTNNEDALYRMTTDGENSTKILDGFLLSLNVSGDWLYFSDDSDGCLYKMNIDGTSKTKLSVAYVGGGVCVIGDWLYYEASGGYGDSSYAVYKVRTDGSENQLVDFDKNSSNYSIGVKSWFFEIGRSF